MFNRQTDNLANAVRLLVAMGGFASAPGPKSGLAVYDAIRKVAARPPNSLARMADALTDAARGVFASLSGLPMHADVLFAQMVDAGLLTPQEIVAYDMDAVACTKAMLEKITDESDPTGEMRRDEMRLLFTRITQTALEPLLATTEYAADLTPAFMAEILQMAHRTERKIDDVAEKLDNLQAQTRDTLEALALRFGELAPEALTVSDLRGFLIEKAQDYRALRQEVEALRGTAPRIDNVLSAVEEAIEALDFDEAERLLASTRDTSAEALRKPIEDHARIIETQARIALMRGRPERAFTLVSGAADSFALLDPLEPFRRRLGYARTFHDYGERFGAPVTEMAMRLTQAILERVDSDTDRAIFCEAQNLLGLSLLSLGRFAAGDTGHDLLGRAAAAFTLTASESEGHLRAAALDHLSLVRVTQAQRSAPPARADLLRASIKGSGEAIELFGDDLSSQARALNNLGNAHLLLADELEGRGLAEALDQAFAALDRATRLFGEIGDVMNMAGARFGVATVIERQATVFGDPSRRNKAINEFQLALQFYRERDMPQDAAMAAGTLGSALLTHATNAPAELIAPLLIAAGSALGEAAVHYRETGQPLAEMTLLRNLALSEEMRAAAEPTANTAGLLERAQTHLRRAVKLDASGAEAEHVRAALDRVQSKLAALS
ncbi:hypothetical protein Q5Y75_17540 [Ruegeria sp. 2205SS24-7]|uniref:hypothetical protein n=1 Tax=Ruegeria discodermiae TaxID=3064389 RepID=UPI0027427A21|nr:hypothetical protein [Ruegeria sp. 2205SS24-7]MDP5219025.1 hypothetical protein [Ruegeria sp. 2205SS24-7]